MFRGSKFYRIKIEIGHKYRWIARNSVKIIPWGPLILASITTITLLVSIYGFDNTHEDVFSGKVDLVPPVGFAIIRGITGLEQPSDHIVLPLLWINTKKKSVIIHSPYLIISELNETTRNISRNYTFFLAGKYNSMSPDEFDRDKIYSFQQMFHLPPDSVTETVMVFHVENWWDAYNETGKSLWNFNFKNTIYNISIGYNEDSKVQPAKFYRITKIPGTINNLTYTGSYYWDYFNFGSSLISMGKG